ncbi:MAG: NAD(P)/FAD-dependent oxidoreductase [Candidatus Aenigmatarchaeota archaeon]|nr:MAG: NAD(P)/FAD-dependent oxidoreductase [Candidatus Aenigmarchaeota archaeon]
MFIKPEYDLIVVGAGPGGTSTAITAAKLGLDVLVLEKQQQVAMFKRCAEGFAIGALEELKLKMPRKCWRQEIDGSYIYAPNMKEFLIDLGQTGGYVLERRVFDKWLAEEAVKAGAQVIADANVYDVIKENDFVCGVKANFIGEEYEIRSKVVVAADGVESLTARRAGFPIVNNPILIDSGFQYELDGIELKDPRKLEFYISNSMAPRGYIWVFPKGESRANVGIGIVGNSTETAKRYLDDFIKKNDRFKKGSVIEVNAGAIPVGGLMKNMVMNGLVLVGDAAHQVYPIHGGGMGEAIIAGTIAGKVIWRCIEHNDWSESALSEYNTLWWEKRGNTLAKSEKVREIVEKLTDEQLNMLADSLTKDDLMKIVGGNAAILTKTLLRFGVKSLKKKIIG